jgi:replicative DNA helicase
MTQFASESRAAPCDHDAEAALIGGMMSSRVDLAAVCSIVSAEDCHRPGFAAMFDAICAIRARGEVPSHVVVASELRGGPYEAIASELPEMAANSLPSAAIAYARIVAEESRFRRAIRDSQKVIEAAYGRDIEAVADAVTTLSESMTCGVGRSARYVDGAEFVTGDANLKSVWGDADNVLWASGEALMVVGPTGVGKTTVAHQLVLHRMGLRAGPLLGLPVDVDPDCVVLYLGMDRPKQAARSLARMVNADQHDELRRRLVVWKGPPERDLARYPEELLAMARDHGAGLVVIDSLKDAAVRLTDDETGALWNRAVQTCLAEGVEVLVLHHQRKSQAGSKPKAIDDVYGSTWITAGAGSVVLLWGSPGDPTVELVHLKQPAALVGPLKIEHDHRTGTSTIANEFDLLAALRSSSHGLSGPEAARLWFGADPNESQRRRTKRTLDGYVGESLAHRRDAREGGNGGSNAARYFATTDRSDKS